MYKVKIIYNLTEKGGYVNFDFTWIIAIISIAGSFFNIKKMPICFYFWIICEIMCLIIDVKSMQYGRAFLDLFCVGMNIYGILAWSKSDKNQKRKEFDKSNNLGIANTELKNQE